MKLVEVQENETERMGKGNIYFNLLVAQPC